MNVALLTAAGSGTRMHQDIPKQFIHVDNKPVIIHTMEAFQKHPSIDAIICVTIDSWTDVLWAYDGHMQYARVFTNPKLFEDFFHKFEEQIMNHKLWLDTKVKEHLVFMQIYFLFFNTIPLMIKRIPLKVEDSIQYTTIERDNVVSENNLVIHSNVKVENDDQSKLVFGQPGGITYLFKYVIPLEEKRCA